MKSRILRCVAAAALAGATLAAIPVAGQQDHGSGHGSGHGSAHGSAHEAAAPADPRAREVADRYRRANERMHAEMDIPFTGDPDRDFAAAMIPHHRGAIAMAEIQLRYGRDPELRKIAEAVVATQAQEVAQFQDWLRRNPPKP
ncbi:CopM family metallochaperone [Arenibaculum pallidiluteum]|uniref:CopM family metallochaperone n=1 Tax=Arenibaculum pallidiluteum TaxID=2812559 RepID=UPI001A9788D5|nr:DUF305 domain-containing protein [Arenibaculum pallidiluteum]